MLFVTRAFTKNDGWITARKFYAWCEGEGKVKFDASGRPYTSFEYFKRFIRESPEFGSDPATIRSKKYSLSDWGYLMFDDFDRVFFCLDRILSESSAQKTMGGFDYGTDDDREGQVSA